MPGDRVDEARRGPARHVPETPSEQDVEGVVAASQLKGLSGRDPGPGTVDVLLTDEGRRDLPAAADVDACLHFGEGLLDDAEPFAHWSSVITRGGRNRMPLVKRPARIAITPFWHAALMMASVSSGAGCFVARSFTSSINIIEPPADITDQRMAALPALEVLPVVRRLEAFFVGQRREHHALELFESRGMLRSCGGDNQAVRQHSPILTHPDLSRLLTLSTRAPTRSPRCRPSAEYTAHGYAGSATAPSSFRGNLCDPRRTTAS